MIDRWFKKKRPSLIAAAAPVAGRLFPLHEVQDDAFSQGFMGRGVAIDPAEGTVVAPIDGRVHHVIDTKHAVIIEHSSGLQLLIHIGINTVDLQGDGFHVAVQAGDAIKAGQRLMEFELQRIQAAGYPAYALIIAVSDHLVSDVECQYRQVRAAEPDVFRIVMK